MIPEQIISSVEQELLSENIRIASTDFTRPWGGFFVLDENDAEKFIALYFPTYTREKLMLGNKLSPKILLVGPQQRLSWQYHNRRAEMWRVVQGEIAVVMSETDEQTELNEFEPGDVIILKKGQRHRLVGLDQWGIVAEIWQHTDPSNPSDEEDIIRLQDDFGRQ
jgi:mannose-6-phosphate isomerase